jgi:hypothetical protein
MKAGDEHALMRGTLLRSTRLRSPQHACMPAHAAAARDRQCCGPAPNGAAKTRTLALALELAVGYAGAREIIFRGGLPCLQV